MSFRRAGLVRWAKFNAVGAMGIAVQLGALAFLRSVLHLNYLVSTALAVEAAVLHNFFWHERFTWADRRLGAAPQRLCRFNLSTGLFSIAGNVLFTKLFVDAGVPYLIANGSAIALCSIMNFIVNDRLVFVGPK